MSKKNASIPAIDLFPSVEQDRAEPNERQQIFGSFEEQMRNELARARVRVDAASLLRAHRAAVSVFRKLVNESIDEALCDIGSMEGWVNGAELPERAKAYIRYLNCDACTDDQWCDACESKRFDVTLRFISEPVRDLMLAAGGKRSWTGAESETRTMLRMVMDELGDGATEECVITAAIEAIGGRTSNDSAGSAPTKPSGDSDAPDGAVAVPPRGPRTQPHALCMSTDAWANGRGLEVQSA